MAVEEFQPMRKRFLKLTLRTKWITPSERTLKTVQENGVGSCVHFCLRSLGPLERCVTLISHLKMCPERPMMGGSVYMDLVGVIRKHIADRGDWIWLRNFVNKGNTEAYNFTTKQYTMCKIAHFARQMGGSKL